MPFITAVSASFKREMTLRHSIKLCGRTMYTIAKRIVPFFFFFPLGLYTQYESPTHIEL